MAFSNPFEINLIFIYLQSLSLEVEKICKFSYRRMNHTYTNYWLGPAYPDIPTTARRDDKRISIPLLPDGLHSPQSSLVDFPKPHFIFSPVQPELITGPIRKIYPSQSILEIMYKSLGLCLEVIWSPAKLNPFVGKFKELQHYDFNKVTIRVAFFQHCV